MDGSHSPVTWMTNQQPSIRDGIRDSSDLNREAIYESGNGPGFLGLGVGATGAEDAERCHMIKDPHPALRLTRNKKKRSSKTPGRTSVLIEEDFYTLFEDCVPTDERLKGLLQRWVNSKQLQRRLLYCRPFHIVFQEPETSGASLWLRHSKERSLTKLVRKSHHELGELLQEGKSEGFTKQLSDAWPESFGSLINAEGQRRCFQWHPGVPRLDYGTYGTIVACRKSQADGSQDLLAVDTPLCPSDNMLWQVLPSIFSSIISMRTIAFLESLFAPTNSNFTSFGTVSDWFPVQHTTPALHSTGNFGRGDWLCIQLNMRTCIPDEAEHRISRFKNSWGISPTGIGFPLQRQAAKIPDLARGTTQFAVEFLLSVSIVLKKRSRVGAPSALNYNIVVWLDYKTNFNSQTVRDSTFPVLSDRIDLDLDLEDCGAGGEGFFHVLIVLTRTIDHWRKCWDTMLDKIDEIISIQLQDTLDPKRWGKLMFDDSFQLSEQYFTVRQLLRIFQNWIGETEKGIQSFGEELAQQCELWQSWRQQHAEMDELEWPLNVEVLRNNIDKVREFFELRVTPLKDRIEKKKEEVASLQDALLNASSLREALKAKTLNLYIGVFTTVTVFFTPLGFITAFWAIPFLDPNSEAPIPSGFTASFVTVPLLTYILSTVIVVYFWARSSRHRNVILWEMPGNIWELVLSIVEQITRKIHVLYQSLLDKPSREGQPEPTMA
ncbi:hypothetical protein GQX73_g4 [Xylaria multiplex]|uniref:Uncharacterized protein n=1 Tax=Xylaria multiplex TaxID=323545 RepID=A0A7C8N1J2_9PEZI|nr:hypothetical protein GQX73_g4 [Xylaria multiplex]